MRRIMHTVTAALLAATFAVGCGGDDDPPPQNPDAMVEPPEPDAGGNPPDGGGSPLTFEEYVVDMIQNRTSDTTNAAPAAEFESLPESGDPDAFDSLFP
jgi:hypothetical protein